MKEKRSMEFSIIIPVYNVRKYLDDCITSVLQQSYTNYELILVDDGSTDGSGILCDEYKKKHPNQIQVIHKKNGGLSSARNAGLAVADGLYVIFIDSDDFFADSSCLAEIEEKIKEREVDVLHYLFCKCTEDGKIQKNESKFIDIEEYIDKIDYYDAVDYLMRTNFFMLSAWSKAVRLDFIKENHLEFKEGVYSEDIDWTYRLLVAAKTTSILTKAIYIYRKRTSSISHSISAKNCRDAIEMMKEQSEYLLQENVNTKLKNVLLGYLSYQFYIYLGFSSLVEKEAVYQIQDNLKDLSWVTEYELNKKTRYCKYMYKILGHKVSARVLGMFIKNRN